MKPRCSCARIENGNKIPQSTTPYSADSLRHHVTGYVFSHSQPTHHVGVKNCVRVSNTISARRKWNKMCAIWDSTARLSAEKKTDDTSFGNTEFCTCHRLPARYNFIHGSLFAFAACEMAKHHTGAWMAAALHESLKFDSIPTMLLTIWKYLPPLTSMRTIQ